MPQDLLKFGLIPEFIGRLPIIATLKDLDKEALIEILVEPKNSLVKQYQKLFEIDGVELLLYRCNHHQNQNHIHILYFQAYYSLPSKIKY